MKKFFTQNNPGFTRIEFITATVFTLLAFAVFIAVIRGIQSEWRDIARISQMKTLADILERENFLTPGAETEGCTQAGAYLNQCTGPGKVFEFRNFQDPSFWGFPPCQRRADAREPLPCSYSISSFDGTSAPKLDDYEICFWLEGSRSPLKKGLNAIKTSGVFGECE